MKRFHQHMKDKNGNRQCKSQERLIKLNVEDKRLDDSQDQSTKIIPKEYAKTKNS